MVRLFFVFLIGNFVSVFETRSEMRESKVFGQIAEEL